MHRLAVAVEDDAVEDDAGEDDAVVAASTARGISSPVAVKTLTLEAALRVREPDG